MTDRSKIITLGEGPQASTRIATPEEIGAIESRFNVRKLQVDTLPEQLRPTYLAAILDAEIVLATLYRIAKELKAKDAVGIQRMARIKAMRAALVELGVPEEELGTDPELKAKIGDEIREVLASEVDFAGNFHLPEMKQKPADSENGGNDASGD